MGIKAETLGVAGFTLAGQRLSNGRVCTFLTDIEMDDWPDHVEFGPNTYTLEAVIDCGEGFENAEYV